MKILFTGDINFRGTDYLDCEKSKKILSDILPYIEKSDYVIPNLECPLGDKEKFSPIKKSGPNLICDENNILFLKAMKAYAVTLANNHIGDYGSGALKNTLGILDENGIKYAGVGENITEAYNAFYIVKDGIKVSVLSVCENEFGIASETQTGSAGYNTYRLMKKIKREKDISDFVIVVFHGGNEFNPLPSPQTVECYRMICDMGADAVVAGHTHCPQGYEIYNEKPIVYSMGNFFFKSSTERKSDNSWYYGYMTMLDVSKKGISLSVIPYKFFEDTELIKVFKGTDKEEMMRYIRNLSDTIADGDELKKYFKGWAWLHQWCPKLPNDTNNVSDYNSAENYNLVNCESHLNQLKTLTEIFYKNELSLAEEWSEKVQKLQKMPL